MVRTFIHYSICMVLLCCAGSVHAETWQATCVKVLDGDSLMILHAGGKKEIRLYGVDAPEFDQSYGAQARACLGRFAQQKELTIETIDVDSYGRTIAKINTLEGSVNKRLIAEGCAWVYTRFCKAKFCKAKYCKAWSNLESYARQHKVGLRSQDEPLAPWDFRCTKRQDEHTQSKTNVHAEGHYRGNTNSFVFHAPGCRYAYCKRCTAGFNSIGAAMRAGYSPCKKCNDN